jgi:hypothetical protein
VDQVERAEVIQNLKAYLIPSGMFLSTVINAAGIFLIYNGYGVGWVLVAAGVTAIIAALVAFARLQNNYRAKGLMKEAADVRVSPPPVVQGAEPAGENDLVSV